MVTASLPRTGRSLRTLAQGKSNQGTAALVELAPEGFNQLVYDEPILGAEDRETIRRAA